MFFRAGEATEVRQSGREGQKNGAGRIPERERSLPAAAAGARCRASETERDHRRSENKIVYTEPVLFQKPRKIPAIAGEQMCCSPAQMSRKIRRRGAHQFYI